MKTNQIKALKDKYLKLIDELVLAIEKSDCEVDVAGDSVDKIQGSSIVIVQDQLARNNLAKLSLLTHAVERIQSGSFDGCCSECGDDIGIRRLEAIPGVTVCIKCAEETEFFSRNSM